MNLVDDCGVSEDNKVQFLISKMPSVLIVSGESFNVLGQVIGEIPMEANLSNTIGQGYSCSSTHIYCPET